MDRHHEILTVNVLTVLFIVSAKVVMFLVGYSWFLYRQDCWKRYSGSEFLRKFSTGLATKSWITFWADQEFFFTLLTFQRCPV